MALDLQVVTDSAVHQVSDEDLAVLARVVAQRDLGRQDGIVTRSFAAGIVAKVRTRRPCARPDVDFGMLVHLACKSVVAAGPLMLICTYVRIDCWDSTLWPALVALAVDRLYDPDLRASRAAAKLVLALKMRGIAEAVVEAGAVEGLVHAWKVAVFAVCRRPVGHFPAVHTLAHLCREPHVADRIVAAGGLDLLWWWLQHRPDSDAFYLLHALALQEPHRAVLLGRPDLMALFTLKQDSGPLQAARLRVARTLALDPRAAAALAKLKFPLL
jgi:hypothetical protein